MPTSKTKKLNKGQLLFIERNKQRIAALPPAVCAKCGEPRKRKNKYCHRCWTNMQTLKGSTINTSIPTYAYCPKSPTEAHMWTLDDHNYGKCSYCNKGRQFTAVIGGDAWGHDALERALEKSYV